MHFVQTLICLMEGFLAAQVGGAAVVEPAVRLPKEFLSEKNVGCKVHTPSTQACVSKSSFIGQGGRATLATQVFNLAVAKDILFKTDYPPPNSQRIRSAGSLSA